MQQYPVSAAFAPLVNFAFQGILLCFVGFIGQLFFKICYLTIRELCDCFWRFSGNGLGDGYLGVYLTLYLVSIKDSLQSGFSIPGSDCGITRNSRYTRCGGAGCITARAAYTNPHA